MTSSHSSQRRRASDVANGLIRTLFGRFRRHDDNKRSLSTGDLAEPQSDYMEMDFSQGPTTSKMAAHLDDTDRVPMDFAGPAPRLLNIHSRTTATIMKHGSTTDLKQFPIPDLHRAQPWFFQNVDSAKAERILMDAGFEEGSFLVYNLSDVYRLCVLSGGIFRHYGIAIRVKDGVPKFRLDLDRSFSNLCDLVAYYRNHRGLVLPTRLKNGVARPVRLPYSPARTRA